MNLISSAMAALLAVAGIQNVAVVGQPVLEQRDVKLIGTGPGRRTRSRRGRGPGWTQAHVKRLARKARNQARNRRAHRGAK